MAKITVIGSFVMDNVATMDRFPNPGESVIGHTLNNFPGGKGANQCVAIARLGGDCEMIGMLGNDDNGNKFLKLLNSENIKTDNIFQCDTPTSVAQIQINKDGENRICLIPGANHKFDYHHIDLIDNIIKETDLMVLQFELRLDITQELIKRAHKYNTKILLNPAPAATIDHELFKYIDFVTPNESELSCLTNLPVETNEQIITAARKLLSFGCKNVIATLGGKGAIIVNETMTKFVKGYKVPVVDTVGAGDSFNGALAVAIMEGKSLEEAVNFANAMGALTVQKQGAIPSLHIRNEVNEFIKNHKAGE